MDEQRVTIMRSRTDDGSCTYAAEGLDCDGACLVGELLTMMIHMETDGMVQY